MNLVIDIGNTLTKYCLFEGESIIHSDKFEKESNDYQFAELFKGYPRIKSVILSSVSHVGEATINLIGRNCGTLVILDKDTLLPIENLYKTKETLGHDRIAVAVGANNIFPDRNVLVIDCGTAITYDFVNSGNQYLGGNISPGMQMRYKSLNYFTDKLPLLQASGDFPVIGGTTAEAIISGVQKGIIYELNGYIAEFEQKYENLQIVLTGGDANFFDKYLKNTIFVDSKILMVGLNKILRYNNNLYE